MSSLTINGALVDISAAPLAQNVLDFLRHHGCTGPKVGCNEGDCGACTILLLEKDGPPRAINGCLALVHSLAGREIVTAEGLASSSSKLPTSHLPLPTSSSESLHPVQQAMIDCHGSQCGYCTPGIVCSLAEAHARGVTDDPAAVADQLCGNLCRCTGYRPIREAAAHAKLPDSELPLHPSPFTLHSSPSYLTPTSITEALTLKAAHPSAPFIAGATELAVLINKRHFRPEQLISLEHIPELLRVESSETHWHLGAAAPLTDIEAGLNGEFPAFDAMLRLFASRQIRHRATLGGNLVTASPIGDSAPLLLALDATVTLTSLDDERTLPLSGFFTGYRTTVLRPDELLTTISLPRHLPGRTEFYKVSKRREMDISTVAAAIRLVTDATDCITEARLAYGGVAATPAHALQTEQALVGLPLAKAANKKILTILANEFQPLTDLRGTAEYRQSLILSLFQKYLSDSWRRFPSALPIPVISSDPNSRTTEADGRGCRTTRRRRAMADQAGVSSLLKSPPHESAIAHVTGTANYTHDLALQRGALAVWPVLSTVARATDLTLDTTAAATSPGVHCILTAADIPGANNTGAARHDEPLFADGGIHYHGQLLAAVIADSEEEARLAAERIVITCTEKPPLLGIENALAAESFHTDPHHLKRGKIAQGLADSPHLLTGTLHLGGQEHFSLETHAALATPDGEGGLHITSSTQHPTETQTIVAEVLGWPRNRIVVESPRMGGGFGGKETQANPWASLCSLAALRTGQAVGLQLDRDHDMITSGKRHPFFAKFEIGYHPDGRLQAADISLYSDGGWSLDLSLPVNDRALFHLDNAYYIPHVRFRGQVCKTNVTSHTAFRGFGGPQGMVVIEEILGRIAQKLGLPPEEVRRRNFYHGTGETNTTHYGEEIEDNRLARIWDELLVTSDFAARKKEIASWNAAQPHHKRGLAITPVKFGISFTLKHYNQAGALVLIYADGSVQVNHGGTEMGQGLHTKILGIAMRELGLPVERVRLMHTRTDKVPNTSATAASSGSDLNGMAVADACAQLRARLAPLAAKMLGCTEDALTYADGTVHGGENSAPFEELIARAYTERIQLSATGFYKTPYLDWDWSQENPKGKPFHYFAFGAAVSEVEVDGFTGMHHIRRVDILHDVGDSLNPAIDRGQIEGGFVQGAGWLTSEELKWNEQGALLTHSASTYAIPTLSDAPLDFRIDLLNEASQNNTIHGSKAVGEPPLMLAISVREALREARWETGGG